MKTKTLSLSLVVTVLALSFGFFSWRYFGHEAPQINNKPQTPTPITQTQEVSVNDGDTYELIARYITQEIQGRSYTMLGYNGSIPGPTLRVAQGSRIHIVLKNETALPQLLHSHGVRMDNAFDGSQLVQKEVSPGESFTYTLTFPDAGVYWYHPHAGEVYGQGRGLYGAFIVSPKQPDDFPHVNREVPLFLSDLTLHNFVASPEAHDTTHTLMGHYGNVLLVNGIENYELNTKVGEVVRLYLTNAANARPFNFAIAGAHIKLIGGDNGAYEHATLVESILLGPSERAIVDVLFDKPGSMEMQHQTPKKTYTLGHVTVEPDAIEHSYEKDFTALQTNSSTTESINTFRTYFDLTPNYTLKLGLEMGSGMSMLGMNHSEMSHHSPMMSSSDEMAVGTMATPSPDGIEWEDQDAMNAMSSVENTQWQIIDEASGKVNGQIDWHLKKNQPVKVAIYNDPHSSHPMQHPIHFHGQRFLVVTRNGVKQTNLVWKDTVLIKAGERVELVLDPSNPGIWMTHCHISEHLESGMMFHFTVE